MSPIFLAFTSLSAMLLVLVMWFDELETKKTRLKTIEVTAEAGKKYWKIRSRSVTFR
tara:strand:+ start:272 stop:442 length:171 start_codon:yes stop_codon:yes gene_type:complete